MALEKYNDKGLMTFNMGENKPNQSKEKKNRNIWPRDDPTWIWHFLPKMWNKSLNCMAQNNSIKTDEYKTH